MANNFAKWGDRRLKEIAEAPGMSAEQIQEDTRKLNERLGKFQEKMNFLAPLQQLKSRKRPSLLKK